ncbi:hypothetical protein DPMN_072772 [Dreissena polymorpha]|uniref:Uncharacterized protein n=1 Tax=Dreissena polymorpha TaxID=45954 RepID=A0A9D4H9X7_DREPO|nr:hypothetical protein DPMN_072772 [Dreissena polymorpha]
METCDTVSTGFRDTATSSTISDATNNTAIPISTNDQGSIGSKLLGMTNPSTSLSSFKTPSITHYL